MKARVVTAQPQLRRNVPTAHLPSAPAPVAAPETEFQVSFSSVTIPRHAIGKLIRLRETYAGSNVEIVSTIARRIRTVLDQLYNEQWKRCVQECDKLLKKHPNFLCATILRSMALYRTDADQAVELVRNESEHIHITDPMTLMCLVYFCMYQAQDERVVIMTLSRYLNNKECYKDSETYGTIMFVYLRYGMFKHFQQIAWQMHGQEHSNRSFKSVLLSLLLMVEVCDTSEAPDYLQQHAQQQQQQESSSLAEMKRSVDCVAKLGCKFMEKKFLEEKSYEKPYMPEALVDVQLLFLSKCTNYPGRLELINHMLAVSKPVPPHQHQHQHHHHHQHEVDGENCDAGCGEETSSTITTETQTRSLRTIKYLLMRDDTLKLMGQYADALAEYKSTILSNITEFNATYQRHCYGSLLSHDAKENIAECICALYYAAAAAAVGDADKTHDSEEDTMKFNNVIAEYESVTAAVRQHSPRKADCILAEATILTHIIALIERRADESVAGCITTTYDAVAGDLPFLQPSRLFECVQNIYRFTSRESPAFYDSTKCLMRYAMMNNDDKKLYSEWNKFLAAEYAAELSLAKDGIVFDLSNGPSVTQENQNQLLLLSGADKTPAWYRQIAVKLTVDDFLRNILTTSDADRSDVTTKCNANQNGFADHEPEEQQKQKSSATTSEKNSELDQIETLMRLFVIARNGEAANEGTGLPHNSEQFGILAINKLYQYCLKNKNRSLLWLCVVITAKMAKSTTLIQSSDGSPKPFTLIDSTQMLFQFIFMNLLMRLGALPAALDVFQSCLQIKNLQIHRYGYYLAGASTFLMPGPAGMYVLSHMCEYMSVSLTEANRFAEQAVTQSHMHNGVLDVMESARHLPTLQCSLLARSLTLHTIWQLFFLPIPQALGPNGILKRFEAYKEDLSNSLSRETSYRDELSVLNTIPTFSIHDVSHSLKRKFAQTVVRDQVIYGQLFDLFAVAFSQAFYLRQRNSNAEGDTELPAGGDGRKNSNSGAVSQAQLAREQRSAAFFEELREQLQQQLRELPHSVLPSQSSVSLSSFPVNDFEANLALPYADPLPTLHALGVFDTFIGACDMSRALHHVLLQADVVVTTSQLASRLHVTTTTKAPNSSGAGSADSNIDGNNNDAEFSQALAALHQKVATAMELYEACLNNFLARFEHYQEPHATANATLSSGSPFWFHHVIEALAGLVWLVQALRLYAHRYTTVLRVSANPLKAMLMLQNADAAAAAVAAAGKAGGGGGDAVLTNNSKNSGGVASQQSKSKRNNAKQQRSTAGATNKSRQTAETASSASNVIKASYTSLEQLLAPAAEILERTYTDGIERGVQKLLDFLERMPIVNNRNLQQQQQQVVTNATTSSVEVAAALAQSLFTNESLFGEPLIVASVNEEQQDAAADQQQKIPAEWERFRFLFSLDKNEVIDLNSTIRRRVLSSWTKIYEELLCVLSMKSTSSTNAVTNATAVLPNGQMQWSQ